MCSICRNHVSVQCTCITNYWVCDKSNTTGATIGSGISYPTRSYSLLPDISGFVLLKIQYSEYCFVDHCFLFSPFAFGHCIVSPSSIYGFALSMSPLKKKRKGHVRNCHVCVSVIVCKLFIFKPPGQNLLAYLRKLEGSFCNGSLQSRNCW